MLILGLDPGLTNFGWAILDPWIEEVKIGGVWTTTPESGVPRTVDLARRLEKLAADLDGKMRGFCFDGIAIEALALPFGRTSMVTVSTLGRVRGLVDYACACRTPAGVRVAEYQAKHVKKTITGVPTADKAEVGAALRRKITGLDYVLASWPPSKHEHITDAAACAVTLAVEMKVM